MTCLCFAHNSYKMNFHTHIPITIRNSTAEILLKIGLWPTMRSHWVSTRQQERCADQSYYVLDSDLALSHLSSSPTVCFITGLWISIVSFLFHVSHMRKKACILISCLPLPLFDGPQFGPGSLAVESEIWIRSLQSFSGLTMLSILYGFKPERVCQFITTP